MIREIKTETPIKNLEIGDKVLYKQKVYPAKANDGIEVGMSGIVCDIDDNTWFNESDIDGVGKLTIYVVFHAYNEMTKEMDTVSDWFTIDELELVEIM